MHHDRSLLLLAWLLVLPHAAFGQSDVTAIARNATPAVVTIRTFDTGGTPLGTGSGFFLPDQRVVTNAHVLSGAARAEVYDHENQLVGSVTHVEALSESVDLAVLPRLPLAPSSLELERAIPEVGSRVVVIGAPRGLSNTVSEGIVSAVRDFEGRRLIQVTAPISQGSSGGPVLDLNGRVIGISVGLLRDGQNLNFAIPARDAIALTSSPSGRLAFPASTSAGGRAASNPAVGSGPPTDFRSNVRSSVEELRFGSLVHGEMFELSRGTAAAMYRFEGRAGEAIAIRVSSIDFDTEVDLYLVTPDSLQHVTGDDDSALGLDAQVSTRLPASGTYVLFVSGHESIPGDRFRVSANRGSTPPPYSAAERYVLVYSGTSQAHIVDRSSMTRTAGGYLRAWIEYRYWETQHASGTRYDTDKTLYEIDCRGRRSRYVQFIWYLEGRSVYSSQITGDWRNWVPGSVGEGGWGATCAMARQMGL
jgi:hypothetical protein